MFQNLISLEDHQIELVLAAVHDWCARAHCSIDSEAGRHAMTAAVDLVQGASTADTLSSRLAAHLLAG